MPEARAAVGQPVPPNATGSSSRLVRYAYFTSAEFLPIDLVRVTDFPAAFQTYDPGKDFGIAFIATVEAPAVGKDFKVRGSLRGPDGAEVAAFDERVKYSQNANWYAIRRLFAMERLRGSTARRFTLDLFIEDRAVGTFGFDVLADPLWAQRPKKETVAASAPPAAPPPAPSSPPPVPPKESTQTAKEQPPPPKEATVAPKEQPAPPKEQQIASAPAIEPGPSVMPLPLATPVPPKPGPPSPEPRREEIATVAPLRPSPSPATTSPPVALPPVAATPAPTPVAPGPAAPTPPAVAATPTPVPPKSPQIASLPPQRDVEPPKVVINYPPVDTKVDKEQILILALVTDNVAITNVHVSVNGTQAAAQTVTDGARAVPVRAQVSLQPGENIIEVTAIDKAGHASQMVRTITRTMPALPEPPAVQQVKHGERWAVIIGVGKYDNAGIPTLKFAERDATSLYEFLTTTGGFKKDNVQILTDTTAQKPTLINIKRSLGEWLARRAAKDDTVIVYYAGHGAPEVDAAGTEADGLSKYLVPRDADPDSLFTTGFPMDDIQRVFARIQAERVVFLVDTCFSGATGGRTFSKQHTRSGHLSTEFLDRLAHSRGRVIITAAGPNELALELPDLGHGVFTYYLLKGMEGEADRDKDGIVTVNELYEYLEVKVSEAARKAGGRQRPIMKGEVEGSLPLIELKKR